MKPHYLASKIGCLFGLLSLLGALTVVFPFICIIPVVAFLELIFTTFFSDYYLVYLCSFGVLLCVFTFSSFLFIRRYKGLAFKNDGFSKAFVILFFILQLFIVHPLIFTGWAMINSNDASDGQFMLTIFGTFPFSSIVIMFQGLFSDWFVRKLSK